MGWTDKKEKRTNKTPQNQKNKCPVNNNSREAGKSGKDDWRRDYRPQDRKGMKSQSRRQGMRCQEDFGLRD